MKDYKKIARAFLAQYDSSERYRKQVMKDLVDTLCSNGASEEDSELIVNKLKKKIEQDILATKTPSQQQKRAWIEDMCETLDDQMVIAYPPEMEESLERNEDNELVNGQYGSMSREEYKRQRSYAEQYQVLDWRKIQHVPQEDIDFDEIIEEQNNDR